MWMLRLLVVVIALGACDKAKDDAPASGSSKAESDKGGVEDKPATVTPGKAGGRGETATGGIAAGLEELAASQRRAAPAPVPAGSAAATAPPVVATGSAAAPAADQPLKVGDRVMARWTNGKWYPGKVVAISAAGLYDINYDDGDKSRGLAAAQVRRKTASTSSGGGGGGSTARRPSNADAPCPGPGLTRRCNGVCVNIQENNNHCGGCNNRCPSGKACDGHLFCRDAEGNL
ncbi:MAG: hypothetical protein WKG01_09625 [Kofleriaceae bacterium]